MRTWKFVVAASMVCCLLISSTSAQSDNKDDQPEIDFTNGPGIKIDAELPEINLKNQDGEEVSIHKMLESDNVALVFYRSASW